MDEIQTLLEQEFRDLQIELNETKARLRSMNLEISAKNAIIARQEEMLLTY